MLMRLFVVVVALFATIAFAQDQKIKPGDRLLLTCEEEATLNREYSVTAQGMILVDFIGAVHVDGLTEAQAAKTVSERLVNERILRQATVKVKIVSTVVAPVTYKGAVRVTGQEPYRQGLRLSDLIKKAQPNEQTDLARIEIRSTDGAVETVDYTKFDPGTNANNPLLKPGDTVTFVAKSEPGLVVVLGGVERPGGVAYKDGMTVRSAIAAVGGFTSLGVTTSVKLERTGQAATMLDLSKPGTDSPVRAGDRIIVALRENRMYVTVSGAVVKGGFIEFVPGMTLSKAIESAGGLRQDADPRKVRLTRAGQSTATTYDVSEMVDDPVLAAGDKVMVDAVRTSKFDILRSLTVLALLFILIGR